MLRITADELDELRIKLLAAVVSGAVGDDTAKQCEILAKDLDGLATLLALEGQTCIAPPPDAIGNLMQKCFENGQFAAEGRPRPFFPACG